MLIFDSSVLEGEVIGVNQSVITWQFPEPVTRLSRIAFHLGAFAIAFLILFSRRPDAVLYAQFYAEDGTYWFADAYNHGWQCLAMPEAGYLHTVPRLVALFTLLFPFALAPLVMNLVAFFFQILPINYFLSSRFNSIPLNLRILGSLLYVAIPNSFEIHANATNIQWHLALLAALVILAKPPQSRAWLSFDLIILALVSIDSPLGIPLVALIAGAWWFRRDNHARFQLLALIPGTALEVIVLLLSHSRRDAENGANLTRLASILGEQVFMSSILGVRTGMQFYYGHMRYLLACELVALFIGLAVIAYALLYAPAELKLFILFSAGVLAMALRHPLATLEPTPGQWQLLRIPGFGNRYYFFLMLSFFASLIWMAAANRSSSRFPRYAALAILLLSPFGIVRDWKYKPFADFNFSKYVTKFEQAAPGTKVVIPTNPTWSTWTMELIKR